jgi:cardiolipin synthase A/B
MQTEPSQLAWIITYTILAIDALVRIWLLFYIPRGRKPTAAMAWLLTIYIAPLVGTILFFVIGSTKLSKRRRMQQRGINTLLQKYTANLRAAGLTGRVSPDHQMHADLAESLGFLAPTIGNKITIINGYTNIIDDMIASIDRAKQYVYVEFFAMTHDDATAPFIDALARARSRGVQVYVLFDTLGSRKYKGYKTLKKELSAMGATWHAMLPISLRPSKYNRPDLRNHRKIVVVDNAYSYIGSLNMITSTYHRKDDIDYIELVSRMEGPVVNECAAVFASDWYSETNERLVHFMTNSIVTAKGKTVAQILPSGPGYTYGNNVKLFTSMIHGARRSVIITNPYLVPDDALLSAIITAAKRGVRVSILNSAAMDQWMVGHAQRSFYDQLVSAGVQIHLYKKPQLVHSKYLVIDQQIGVVGSSNLDIRSFELNLECISIYYDGTVAKKLYRQHMSDLDHATMIRLKSWRKRSKVSEMLDSIARLTSALQ